MWSFVGCKQNKQWLWIALDADSREVVAFVIGNRGQDTAQTLWNALPLAYRQGAICYTDEWEAYAAVIPPHQHRPVKKDSGKTNYIERFNCTLRQRVSRLVRKTLSFSKKLTNHIGAIWYFIHYYNASLSLH
jgi:insertion element IS1 protein InsB